MKENKNDGWPERFDLFPRITKVVHFIFDHIQSPGISDHANKGGGPMLDEMLFTENISGACDTTIDLTETVPESTQLMLDYWTVEP